MDLTEIIQRIIFEKGLKKKHVAEAIHLTPQQFSDLLAHRRNLNHENVIPLCEVLGISPNELYGYEGQTKSA